VFGEIVPMLELKLKIWLEKNGETVFGLGRYELLKLVDELGSLHKAAEALGISYRSAWGKIRDTERRLGFKLLERKVGGKSGGGSVLTDEAHALLKEYEKLERRIKESAHKAFAKSRLHIIVK